MVASSIYKFAMLIIAVQSKAEIKSMIICSSFFKYYSYSLFFKAFVNLAIAHYTLVIESW